MFITLKGNGIDHTVRVGPDVAVDYGRDGEIHGIEILSARKHFGFRSEKSQIILEQMQGIPAT